MINEPPPPLALTSIASRPPWARRHRISLKLLLIAALILLLQAPLYLINTLQQERRSRHSPETVVAGRETAIGREEVLAGNEKFEPYRIVERALKHSVLVLALVFTAFFLFETLASLRLHAVHYALVGGAMCLFYLALLALGEVLKPAVAYVGAAGASSLLIVAYSSSVLQSWTRAGVVAGLLVSVHGVLYVVLRMEFYALLAGTAALFAALAAVMFFTRQVDWSAHDSIEPAR